MRIGIVSDLHCNAAGLRGALDLMGDVDELFCAGDIVFEYRFGNEVIELLRERGARAILGNHDTVLLGPHGARARAAPHVMRENVDWLAAQPLTLDIELAGKRVQMFHGNPFEPHNDYLYPGNASLARLAQIDADYVLLGHTHMQFAERIGRPLVINPGSAGDGRDHRNNRALSYAVLDLVSGEAHFEDYEDPASVALASR